MLALLFLAAATPTASELIDSLNRVRADPPAYAQVLENRLRYYRGTTYAPPGETPLLTSEGAAPVRHLISVLKKTRPLPPVRLSSLLSRAAASHVADIGPKGSTSHQGSDGSNSISRIQRVAPQARKFGEVIAFGAPDVIAELLIDDGVASRGHRKILLDEQYEAAGAACGVHKTYGTVCVIDLADRAP